MTRIGLVLPTRGLLLAGGRPDFGRILALAEQAEAAGCDSLWAGDSLTAKPRLEALSVLAAVAARTQRVRLGTSVLLAPLRHPVLLAQTAATVDIVSGGRLTLGIGVGGTFNPEQRAEWDVAGVNPARRGARLDEMLPVMQALWAGESVTHHGRHFDLEDAALGFGPLQRPGVPLLLTCHSGENRARQYERAARYGAGMISITDSPDEFAAVRSRVLEGVRAAGRPAESFAAAYYLTVNLNHQPDAALHEADAWVKAYYGVNLWGERWGPYGTPEAVVERARRYVSAGADDLIFRFASPDQAGQLALFEREVLPALK